MDCGWALLSRTNPALLRTAAIQMAVRFFMAIYRYTTLLRKCMTIGTDVTGLN